MADESNAALVANETTSLLDDGAESTSSVSTEQTDSHVLPKLQIFLLSVSRLVEPLACFVIFPFINQMIYETGVPVEDVGFYSGLIVGPQSIYASYIQLTSFRSPCFPSHKWS